MKKNKICRSIFLIVLLIMIPLSANADNNLYDVILNGQYKSPVTVTVSSPLYSFISEFGESRTEMYNRMLKHFSISLTLDNDYSDTALLIDQAPVVSYMESNRQSLSKMIYLYENETAYDFVSENELIENSSFLSFLENDFFKTNNLLDELYPLFIKTADAFQQFSKPSSASISFKGYGKGVRKVTIPLSGDYVKEYYSKVLSDLADTEESRRFIGQLVFSGPQKIILLYDQDDQLLRINYDGTVGFDENSMRRVSLVWRCLRNADQKKDNLTLKTPAQKGYNKYNMVYSREKDNNSLNWQYQLDFKEDDVKKKISFNAEFQIHDGIMSGEAVFSEKQEDNEKKINILPVLKKEKDAEYDGTIEITDYSGKIVVSSIRAEISVSSNVQAVKDKADTVPVHLSSEEVKERISSVFIRRLLLLPADDISFLSQDIPVNVWESLLKSLK